MIAFKDKGNVYFAVPMSHHAYSNTSYIDYNYRDNCDAWHINDENGTIVMVDAVPDRLIDLLRYSDTFNCELTRSALHEVKEKIDKIIDESNCLRHKDRCTYGVIIAQGDKAFEVRSFGTVIEVDNFKVVDEARHIANAVYENVEHIEDVNQRVIAYYNKMSDYTCTRLFPIALISTKDNSYTLLTK